MRTKLKRGIKQVEQMLTEGELSVARMYGGAPAVRLSALATVSVGLCRACGRGA